MSARKKTRYAPLSAAANERLEPYRELMGKRPDGEIAKLAQMDRRYVVVFRFHNDIPPYRRGAALQPTSGPAHAEPQRRRRSKLDEFRHLMGDVADGRVAELAGCSREAVMRYRKRHGIPPAPRRRTNTRPAAPNRPAAATPRPASLAPEVPTPAPANDLPPEADEVLQPAETPATPAPVTHTLLLEGWMVTVRHDGEDLGFFLLATDLAQAARQAVDNCSATMPGAQVVELRYTADLL